MYILNNKTYTPEVLTKAAEKQGLTLEELIAKKGIKPYSEPEEVKKINVYSKDGIGMAISETNLARWKKDHPGGMTEQEILKQQADYKAQEQAYKDAKAAEEEAAANDPNKDVNVWQDVDLENMREINKTIDQKTVEVDKGTEGAYKNDEGNWVVDNPDYLAPGSTARKNWDNRFKKGQQLGVRKRNDLIDSMGKFEGVDSWFAEDIEYETGFGKRIVNLYRDVRDIEQKGSKYFDGEGSNISMNSAGQEKLLAQLKSEGKIGEDATLADITQEIEAWTNNYKEVTQVNTALKDQAESTLIEFDTDIFTKSKNAVTNQKEKTQKLEDNATTLENTKKLLEEEKAIEIEEKSSSPYNEEYYKSLSKEEKNYYNALQDRVTLENTPIGTEKFNESELAIKDKIDKDVSNINSLKNLATNLDDYLYTVTGVNQKEITAGRSMKGWLYSNQEEIDRLSEELDLNSEDVINLLSNPATAGSHDKIEEMLGVKIPQNIKHNRQGLDLILEYKGFLANEEHKKNLEERGFIIDSWGDAKGFFQGDATGQITVEGEEFKAVEPSKELMDWISPYAGDPEVMRNLDKDQQRKRQDEGLQEAIANDTIIQTQISDLSKAAVPELMKYKKELETNHPNATVEDTEKINKLLLDKQHELTIGKLLENPEFNKRANLLGMAIGLKGQEMDARFAREDSGFLMAMDWVRGGENDFIPFNDSFADTVEGFVSASHGIGVSIGDKAWGSYAGNRYRNQSKKANELQQQLANGDFTENDKVRWSTEKQKYIVSDKGKEASNRLENLRHNANEWQLEVVEQIEDIAESEEYLAAFKQANFQDGIGFEDIFLTVGQALPHIGMAAGGTALGLATGGTALAALAPIATYAGTAMMGLQMYGDNYWSAIEQNMKDKGLNKESLRKQFPDLSESEIDEKWKTLATENLMSGEGAHMGHSAAMAAVQTALEKYGAEQIVGGTAKALKGKTALKGLNMGSIFKTSWDDTGKWLLRGALEKGEEALKEFGTEYMQEIVGQVSTATQAGKDPMELIDTSAAFQAGVGGAITGFALPFAGSIANQTTAQIRNAAADIALKYRPESGIAKRATKLNQWFQKAEKELDRKYKKRDTNPEQEAKYYEELNTLNNVRNANLKITKQGHLNNMNESQFSNLLNNYVDLEYYNAEITQAAKEKNYPLENALKEERAALIEKTESIVKAERTTFNVARTLKDLGKSKDMVVVDNEAQLRREAKKRNVALDPKNPTVGFFTNDGKFVVDKQTAADMKEGNTAAHEMLHKVLFNTLYEVDGEGNIKGKNVARGLAAALDTELDKLDPSQVADSKFKKKLELYKKDPAAYKAEEKITLFADAIESGDLKFDEGLFTAIGDKVRRFLQAVGLKDVKFNSGRDVYNFLKDYNKSIKKGKLNQAQRKMMEQGAEVGSDIRRFQGTEGKLGKVNVAKENKAIQDSYEQTNELLADEDFDLDNTFDQKRALKEAGGVIEATTQRLWDPKSLLTRDEFKKTLEKEYLESLSEYDADRDIEGNAGKSISNKFNLRAAKVAKDNIGKVEAESLDSDQAQQTVDTTEQKDFDAPVAKQDKARAKKYPSSLRTVNKSIPQTSKKSLIGGVDATTGKTTGVAKNIIQGVGQNANPESVAKNIIASTKDKSVMQQMRKDVGKFGTDKYNKFVDNVVDEGLTKTIPAATIKRRLGRKANVESGLIDYEQTGTTPTKKITAEGKRTDFNKPVYKINKVDNTKLKEYFKAGEKRSQSLFSMLAEGMVVEGLSDLKNDKAFMKKLQDTLDLKGVEMTADQYMSDLENSLDQRTKEDTSLDIVKANKALKTEEQTLAQAEKNLDAIDQRIDTDLITADQTFEQFRNQQVKENQVDRSIFDENRDQAREAFNRIKKDRKSVAKSNKALIDAGQAKDINQVKKDLEIKGDITVTNKNRKQRQQSILRSVKQGRIPSVVLKLLGLGNFGAKRRVTKNGDYEYQLDNGEWMMGIPREDDKGNIRTDKNGKKLYSQPTQTMIESEYPGATLQAGRGSLYSGVNDPAYIEMMAAAEENNQYYDQATLDNFKNVKRIKIPKGKKLTVAEKKALKAQEKINQKALQDFGMMLDKGVNIDGTMPIEDASLLISQAYQGTNSLIKIAAPFTAVSQVFTRAQSGKQANRSQNYIEEHSPPASTIGASMIAGLKNNNMKEVMKGVKDNFIQFQLSNAADRKLDIAKLNDRLPEGISILTPNAGILRLAAAGINTNTIIDLETGKPLANKTGLILDKKFSTNLDAVNYQNRLMLDVAKGDISLKNAQKSLKLSLPIQESKSTQVKANKSLNTEVFSENKTADQQKETMLNSQETAAKANKVLNKETKGISVFDLDGTLANTKEKVIVKMPDGSIKKINAIEFAEQADILTQEGAEFDFSEFTDVKGAKKGPLADLALKRQNKFGSGDIYVLTARPQASAQNIKLFLDSIGLNIPIENITGLEDGSPQAKADWVLAKTSEGYNDFYFADDSKMNVDAVDKILSQVDVKSKVQVAKANKATVLDKEFNDMLEETTGLKSEAEYSRTRAKLEGKKKDRGILKWLGRQLSISASAEDFMGLMYDLVGKAKAGTRHLQWIKDKLMDPYNKAEQQILSAKVAVANDFAALKKKFPSLRSKKGNNPLLDQIGVGPFTKSHAVRVYNWVKQGIDMTQHGMSKRDVDALMKAVENDNELRVFADEVGLIQKDNKYPPPGKDWQGGDIATDITDSLEKGFRRKAMVEFDENVSIIFSDKNMHKLEGLFGSKWVEALKDSLRRMKSGSNRPVYTGGGSRIVNGLLDWLNGSVGAIMFLNTRSGLLQLISNINFINWGDNNIVAAAKAFASKDYIPTVMKLLNSDYLVNRRDGLKINVNEAELANAAKQGGMKGMIAYLLDKGFVITRIMDSLAIATGGATFFINRKAALLKRINKETGKLYTEAEAETKAFDDFYAIAEESQQSSNPSKISQQQASLAGRVILSFQNVTMQYTRLTKKSIRDLINRRRGPGQTQREADLSNVSKIVYYMGVQNVIFHSLQKLLFAGLFDDEEDEKTKDKAAEIANGMLDSILFGLGFGGAGIATMKNVILELMEQHGKKSAKYEEAVWKLFDFSPVLDNKVRKMRSGFKTFSWNKEEIRKRGWSLDNPAYLAISQIIAAGTNIPIDRVLRKSMNLRAAMDEETKNWQKIALVLGWDTWSVGLPYWGLESTIKKEAEERAKAKEQYKYDIKKLKKMGYKKGKDNGPDVIEVEHFSGVIQYWSK